MMGGSFSCSARFGLLKKAAKKEDSHKERKESNAEHHAKDQPRKEGTPGREFSQQQKVFTSCPRCGCQCSSP